jgi:hypothetical protein
MGCATGRCATGQVLPQPVLHDATASSPPKQFQVSATQFRPRHCRTPCARLPNPPKRLLAVQTMATPRPRAQTDHQESRNLQKSEKDHPCLAWEMAVFIGVSPAQSHHPRHDTANVADVSCDYNQFYKSLVGNMLHRTRASQIAVLLARLFPQIPPFRDCAPCFLRLLSRDPCPRTKVAKSFQ